MTASSSSDSANVRRNWIDRRRDREMEQPPPERQEDMAAELKRLRRENKVLRQERDIPAKAVAWFARETGSIPSGPSSS